MYLETNIPPYCGGIERVTWNVSKYLENLGYECFYGFVEEDSKEIDINHKTKFNPYGSKEVVYASLFDFVKKNNIDVILNQGFYYRGFCEAMDELKAKTGLKLVSCIHYSINELFPRNFNFSFELKDCICKLLYGYGMRTRILRPFYSCSDKLVMLSESYCPDVIKYLRMENVDRLCAVANPLTFGNIKIPSFSNRKKQVLVCARMTDPQKNISGALKIWKEIENRGHKEWKLVICGTGPDEHSLRNYAKELRIERITWLGQVEKPVSLYLESSIFMMTSNWEGRPVTIPEALQTGCVPIVYDSFLSLKDLITDGKDGVIVAYPNERLFVDKLEELMVDEDNRLRLSEEGPQSSQRFTLENIGMIWDKLFKEIKSKT